MSNAVTCYDVTRGSCLLLHHSSGPISCILSTYILRFHNLSLSFLANKEIEKNQVDVASLFVYFFGSKIGGLGGSKSRNYILSVTIKVTISMITFSAS